MIALRARLYVCVLCTARALSCGQWYSYLRFVCTWVIDAHSGRPPPSAASTTVHSIQEIDSHAKEEARAAGGGDQSNGCVITSVRHNSAYGRRRDARPSHSTHTRGGVCVLWAGSAAQEGPTRPPYLIWQEVITGTISDEIQDEQCLPKQCKLSGDFWSEGRRRLCVENET